MYTCRRTHERAAWNRRRTVNSDDGHPDQWVRMVLVIRRFERSPAKPLLLYGWVMRSILLHRVHVRSVDSCCRFHQLTFRLYNVPAVKCLTQQKQSTTMRWTTILALEPQHHQQNFAPVSNANKADCG